MKKFLLSTVALLGMMSAAAAADLPRRAMAPAPFAAVAPMFTWTGFYVGLHGGYAFSDNDVTLGAVGPGPVTTFLLAPPTDIPAAFTFQSDGFMAGGQLGYNMQFGSWLAGLEVDASWTDVGDSVVIVPNVFASNNLRYNLDFFGTVRGRVGMVFDRSLIYATGGLAYGDVNFRGTITPIAPFFFPTYAGGSNDIETGYTIGGGFEYAFTNNLTFKAEYLFYDLGNTNITLAQPAPAGAVEFVNFRMNNEGHIARGGINFKF